MDVFIWRKKKFASKDTWHSWVNSITMKEKEKLSQKLFGNQIRLISTADVVPPMVVELSDVLGVSNFDEKQQKYVWVYSLYIIEILLNIYFF